MANTIYRPLLAERVIRLLFIESCESGEISASIREFNLDDQPHYHALSYTWGPATGSSEMDDYEDELKNSRNISCNGKPFQVRGNLFDALMFIPKTGTDGKAIFWWIDAICIDQDNLAERMEQISIMGDIYRQASQVCIWLGKDTTDLEGVLWATEKLLPIFERVARDKGMVVLQQRSLLQTELQQDTVDEIEKLLPVFFRFLKLRRWFSRIWVAQEVANATSITVLCENKSLSWTKLLYVSYLISKALSLGSAGLKHKFSTDWMIHILWFEELRFMAVDAIDSVKAETHAGTPSFLLPDVAEYWARDATQEPYCFLPFLSLVLSGMKCSNKRDNLYALYGLLRWIFPDQNCVNLVADYSLSIRDAYVRATSTILRNSDYLLITGLVEQGNERTRLGLPSWVPLYGETTGQWPITFAGRRQNLDASFCRDNFQQEFRHAVIGENLIVHGFQFCHVAECPKKLSDIEKLKVYLSLIQSCRTSGRDALEDLWKTLLWDDIEYFETFIRPQRSTTPSERLKYKQELAGIHTLMDQNEGDNFELSSPLIKTLGEHSRHFFDNVSKNRSGSREVFRTNLGGYGFAANGVESGDILFCVMTSTVPLILRQRKGPRGEEYAFVAEAYLYGFMHGEMMHENLGFEKNIRSICIS